MERKGCDLIYDVFVNSFRKKEKCDILIITEHKLKESTHNYLDSIHNEYACFVKLDDGNIMYHNSAFADKGGVAIMYKKSVMFSVKEVTCYNTRGIIGIKLDDHSGNTYYKIIIFCHLIAILMFTRKNLAYLKSYTHIIRVTVKLLLQVTSTAV